MLAHFKMKNYITPNTHIPSLAACKSLFLVFKGLYGYSHFSSTSKLWISLPDEQCFLYFILLSYFYYVCMILLFLLCLFRVVWWKSLREQESNDEDMHSDMGEKTKGSLADWCKIDLY